MLSEGLAEEAAFLLTEWLASVSVHGSIGFPEIVVPVVVLLRRSLKNSNLKAKSSGKEHGIVKTMLERVEESARWIEQKRSGVTFSPSKVGNVQEWEEEIRKKLHESPLGKYLKIQRKAREKRQSLNEKVCSFFPPFGLGDNKILTRFPQRHEKAKMRLWRKKINLPSGGLNPCLYFIFPSPGFSFIRRATPPPRNLNTPSASYNCLP